ncbi:hypothetical protein QQ045_006404 [Rhodiola kirilowii]
MNSAYLALIPKVASPENPEDYRPISCCNVMYKIISSVLACRIREIPPSIISEAQGAFVEDRSITGNICLAQQFLSGYGRRNIGERGSWKIDLSKAYNSINWKFLDHILQLLKFPRKFITWMTMCVQTTKYSILLKGEMVNYFEGKRGLCQGWLLFPFQVPRVKLSHILFADDLFLFSNGRNCSILALKKAVDHFLAASGLSINSGKSQIFAGGLGEAKCRWLEAVLDTKLHALPEKYLGIPLNAKRLTNADCVELLYKLSKRLNSWSGRFLSRAGRSMLINSVLQAMVLYLARVFIFPKQVIRAMNAICANFLWRGGSARNGGHMVAWDMVCKAKSEGGLCIKDLKTFNDALVMKQLWDLQENKQNLWIDWLKAYWSKGRDWWLDSVDFRSSWIMQRLSYCKELGLECISSGDGGLAKNEGANGILVRDTYEMLRVHCSEVEWDSLVWNSFNAPRDSVNAWLACQDRLMTKDKILRMSGNVEPSCVLVGKAEESRNHLFFRCPIAEELWREALNFVGVSNGPSQWHLLISWFKRRRRETLQTRFLKR